MNHTFWASFVLFVARLGNDSHVLGGFCAFRCPISGGEVLVSKPVAARGFMSGRGPEAVLARANGRDEVSEANEGF